MCCEYMLGASCSQAAGGNGAGAGGGTSPRQAALLAADRQWLRHAFNAHQPEAGEADCKWQSRSPSRGRTGWDLLCHI